MDVMPDSFPLTDENTQRLLDIVAALQPVTTRQIQEELARRYGLQVDLAELSRYLGWLRSGFPRRVVRAGLERWAVIELA